MGVIVLELLLLLLLDLVFVGLICLAMVPLATYKKATYAVLKRNFVGYFSNPTGYVFLFLFVVLTSIAAFWPHEFFNSNMATLHQLNAYLPYIMLIFIPAITMSMWAEERREGTDELLLTIPADDLDIVLGKFFAAGSVFTVSLLYSQVINFIVLNVLAQGQVDIGLFFTTYLGYWLLGLGMLSIGMVASFLTNNLTVAFVLGALFNAPLACAALADTIADTGWAQAIAGYSLSAQLDDFGRGVISLSSVIYFVMLMVVGVYLSIMLIGRRHWLGGRDGHSMLGHYLVRTLALIILAIALNYLASSHDLIRYDATSQGISSLSKQTQERLDELKLDRPVFIEAYISETLPEAFVKTKVEMITLLREIESRGGGKIKINIHDDMTPFSKEAKDADEQYGIRPVGVITMTRGSQSREEIFLAAAFSCGLERVVVDFFGQAMSTEYQLVRSISTVAEASPGSGASGTFRIVRRGRPKIGIVRTDAKVTGTDESDFMAMMQGHGAVQPQALVTQLRKQYDTEDVDPSGVIDTGFRFSVSVELADDLDRAVLGDKMRKAFDENGYKLPKNLAVIPLERKKKWLISSLLFAVGADSADQLDGGKVADALRSAFKKEGFVLSDKASVSAVEEKSRWKITDKQGDADVTYSVRRIADRLNVYSGDKDEEQSYTIRRIGGRLNVYEDAKYDVLLVVQPSSLTSPQLRNVIGAIQNGQPTALFEDPLPYFFQPPQNAAVVGTDDEKPPMGGMMGMPPRPQEPKGREEFKQLMDLLGVKLARAKQATAPQFPRRDEMITWNPKTAVVRQEYNPYPKVRDFGEFVVFANVNAIDDNDPDKIQAFNSSDPSVSDLREVAFLTPGAIEERSRKSREAEKLEFIPLVRLGRQTGLLAYGVRGGPGQRVYLKPIASDLDDREETTPWTGELQNLQTVEGQIDTGESYILAARLRTKLPDTTEDKEADDEANKRVSEFQAALDVILVSDIDVLESTLVTFRDQPALAGLDFMFQNPAFVLNVLDALAGDNRFVEIRKRQPDHASLRLVERRVREARQKMQDKIEEFEEAINKQREDKEKESRELLAEAQARVDKLQAEGKLDSRAFKAEQAKLEFLTTQVEQERKDREELLKLRLQEKLREEEHELNLDKQRIEDFCKFLAVSLPPIPPLLVGLIVFFARRLREREGVSRERLRI